MIEAIRGLLGAASGYGMLWLIVAGLVGLMLTAIGSFTLHLMRMILRGGAARPRDLAGAGAAAAFVALSLGMTFGPLRGYETPGIALALVAAMGIGISHLAALRRPRDEPDFKRLHTGFDKIALLALAASLLALFAPVLMIR